MKQQLIIGWAMLLLACNSPEPVKELPAMRQSETAWGYDVHNFLSRYGNQGKAVANDYFKQAKPLIKSQPEKAIWYMKRAITICPQESYYKELSTLLLDLKRYDEAFKYLGVLVEKVHVNDESVHVFDKPDMDTYHQYLIAGILANPGYVPFNLLSSTREDGIDLEKLRSRLEADERFPYKKGSEQYKEFSTWFVDTEDLKTYADNPDNFNQFFSELPSISSQFAIDKNNISQFNYSDYRGDDIVPPVQQLKRSFLPEVKKGINEYPNFNLLGGIRINEQVVMIIYKVDSSASTCPVAMRHIYYNVATYQNNGTLIDFQTVAWQSGETMATADISSQRIATYAYKRRWKKEYNMFDFDNDLLSTTKTGEINWLITAEGKIEQQH